MSRKHQVRSILWCDGIQLPDRKTPDTLNIGDLVCSDWEEGAEWVVRTITDKMPCTTAVTGWKYRADNGENAQYEERGGRSLPFLDTTYFVHFDIPLYRTEAMYGTMIKHRK